MALTLKKKESTPPPVPDQMERIPKATKFRVARPKTGAPSLLLFLAGFFISGGLGAFFLYNFATTAGWVDMNLYKWFRLALIVIFIIVLIGTAFQQSPIHGMLCMIFPPYILAYTLAFLDSPALKGLIVGIVAWLAAEMYYIKRDSFVVATGQTVSRVISGVNGMIERASR